MTRFKKGESGNPKGRPPGIKDRRALYRELLAEHAPALIKRVVQAALDGDMTALKLLMDRLIPPLKAVELPLILNSLPDSAPARGEILVRAMAAGELSPSTAAVAMSVLASQAEFTELANLADRLKALETAESQERNT